MADYPQDCIQYSVPEWWQADQDKTLCRGALIETYVQFYSQTPFELVAERLEAETHQQAHLKVQPLYAGGKRALSPSLPVAGLPRLEGAHCFIASRAKKRPRIWDANTMKSNTESKLPEHTNEGTLASDVIKIVRQARSKAYTAVNSSMVQAYWLMGRRIVEEEQGGEKRAEYGKRLVETLSKELTAEFGKGFDARELRKIRQFYLTFPIRDAVSPEFPEGAASPILHALSAEFQRDKNTDAKRDAVRPESDVQKWHSLSAEFENDLQKALFTKLSWTHIRHLLRVSDPAARDYYIREAAANAWSTRTLDRNISTQYYQRLLASQVKEPVVREMEGKTAPLQNEKLEFIKNPSVLEFLDLPVEAGLTESKIESAIIDNLHHFLLELGKGFAFVERQKLIRTETRDYFIDLVFYNYILKCFVLIDLKTERIAHQDVGQMDMYVRMYDETIKGDDDNPTVGIVLCSETDHDIARYSILKGNEQIFATKYKLYLPTEEELAAEIAREKELIRLQLEQKGN